MKPDDRYHFQEDVRLVSTAKEIFGSKQRAALLFLPHSTMLVGKK